MHVEKRLVGGKRKYYLAHSYRSNSKIMKARVFLGTDLDQTEVERLAEKARARLEDKIRSAKRIGDPYRTVLSSQEMNEITLLTTKVKMKLAHLSEDNWVNFTEEFTYDTNAIEGSTVSKKEVRQVLADGQWPEKSNEEISGRRGCQAHQKDPGPIVVRFDSRASSNGLQELQAVRRGNEAKKRGRGLGRRQLGQSNPQRSTCEPGRFPVEKAGSLVQGQQAEIPSLRSGCSGAQPVRDDSPLPRR